MSIFHFCMCNLKKKIIYIFFYKYIYNINRVLRVLFPGVVMLMLDTRISVSSCVRVHVSGDLDSEARVTWGFMHESESEVFMEKFAFLIKPTVHGARIRSRSMCTLPNGVGV
jgi:hypothetical protein